MKNVFRVIKNIIFIIAVLVIGYGLIGNFSAKNSRINNIVKFSNYVITTGSMEPSISPGDYITVIKVDYEDLNVKDVITYKDDNGYNVTHQIIRINDNEVITQGTANNVSDSPVSKDRILGKYLFKIPKVGYLMAFLSSTAGLILVIGLLVIYVFWELTDEEKRTRKANSVNISKEEYEELIKIKNNKGE
ncbi:MAG: signal peptidase I [Clostridiales bacterium]|nr:signal peptidase I [Clostridiales bacterium]